MKRRDNIKLLLAGSIGASLATTESCKSKDEHTASSTVSPDLYGRTKEELEHDKKVIADTFFTPEELTTVTILSDIIIPKDEVSGSATDAGVPAFIEFMMKDQPNQQLPMRGGLQWLDNLCNDTYGTIFSKCTHDQQIQVIDRIAYPDKALPEMKPGVKFFNLMRNMVATGFFTSQIGIKDIGYKGNQPNEWDGVPPEILAKHGFALDEKYIDLYIKPSERNQIAQWT
jgi:hypothetical protein